MIFFLLSPTLLIKFSHFLLFFLFFFFPSFASSEAKEIIKNKNENINSNHDTKSNTLNSSSHSSLSHLFKISSQEIESTYSRSLEISEKYFDLNQSKI